MHSGRAALRLLWLKQKKTGVPMTPPQNFHKILPSTSSTEIGAKSRNSPQLRYTRMDLSYPVPYLLSQLLLVTEKEPPPRGHNIMIGSYFTELNGQKYLFYLVCLVYVICTSVVVIIEPFLSLPCVEEHKSELEFENVLFRYSICDYIRHLELLFLTRAECERGRHLLSAVFFGSLIGYERRSSDRPAGIRTMALVSLGSALFTINSTFGFLEGPMVSTTVC
jgi:hypothetical protein